MRLLVDIGNTHIKAALSQDGHLCDRLSTTDCGQLIQWAQQRTGGCAVDSIIAASVASTTPIEALSKAFGLKPVCLTADTLLPFSINYLTPQTLGADRLATAAGARRHYPNKPTLIIDAGTCITIDIVDATGTYRGGSITTGLHMKAEALHQHTKRLPLVSINQQHSTLPGRTTEEAIGTGVMRGTAFELDGFYHYYASHYPELQCLLTGGDTEMLHPHLTVPHHCMPDLLFDGLDYILSHTQQHIQQ